MSSGIDEKTRAQRQEFYDRLAPGNIAPLWEVLKGLMPREPRSKAAPFR